MSAADFLDTNILVYAVDLDSPDKRAVAQKLVTRALAGQTGIISFQVLQETLQALTRRSRVVATSECSFHDSLILGAALESGCKRLLTEDLQHGQQVDGLRIENQFLG
jgi:predicted nucleic acid-binding protein